MLKCKSCLVVLWSSLFGAIKSSSANLIFESYGFIHVHIVIIMMKLIVLNDSIGGHIHIICDVFLFLVTTTSYLLLHIFWY
jgi:hypothetical protein